jgi:MFS family permease
LVTRWFEGDRGKALGITNMPFFLLLVPPAAALLVEHGGRKLLFLALAAAFLVIMPILRQIVEAPDRIGQVPRGRVSSSALKAVLGNRAGLMSSRAIFRNSKFWLLSIGMGILTGSGIAFVTHFIAIVSGKGIASAAAALPLSSYGAGTLVGALFFGWLIDRVGPLASLAINTAVQAGLWFLLISVSDFSMLVVIAGLIGAGLGAAVALHGAALNEILGSINFSRGMGFSYLIKVPFLFGAAPLAGYFYDRSNNYNFALLFYGACLALSSVIFAVLAFSRKRPAQAALLAG